MSDLILKISQPVNGSGYADATPVPLQGSVTGDSMGLFFKWFSSLNSKANVDHPELNLADHTAAILNWSVPLAEFGSHVIVLAATDQDGNDPASVKAVTRAATAGGAPPAAKPPCVVHQVGGALFHTSVADGQTLSKASATVAVLAPGAWVMPDPDHSGEWIDNSDYQALNGVELHLNLAPEVAPDPTNSADIPLTPLSPALPPLPFFRDSDKAWLRWTGALPAKLGTGNHLLSLIASAGSVSATVTRHVVLTA
jgi:hypothetical protein